MKFAASYLFCWLCLITAGGHADSDDSVSLTQSNVIRAIDIVYRPRHEEFSESARQLKTSIDSLCSTPTNQAVKSIRDQFSQVVDKFSRVELYRVGPLMENNRKNRLFYWPDKRRAGERQMRALLASEELPQLDAEVLSSKSVALQGLPAFERVLYRSMTDEPLSPTFIDQECRVLQAIAGNMLTMADALSTEWNNESGIVQSMTSPHAGSMLFRSDDEVLRSLVTQIVVGLDVIVEQKLAPLIKSESSKVRGAPLWRSQNTLSMIDGNVQGIGALLLHTGLAERTQLAAELAFEFRTAAMLVEKLSNLNTLIDARSVLSEQAYALFKALNAVVDGIRLTVNDRFVSSLGVRAGFNSEDGD